MPVAVKGTGGGSVTLTAGAAATDTTLTLPNTTGTVALTASPTFSGTVTATTVTSPASTALTIQSAGTTAMTVNTSQYVGIGTTSPQQLLAVGNTTDQVGAGISGAVSTVYLGAPSNASGGIKRISYDRSTGSLNFIGGSVASPSTQMTLDDTGNLLVGTTSAVAKFAVSSGGTATYYGNNTNASDFFVANMNQGNSSSTALYVMPMRFGNSTLAGSIYWNGTNVVFNTSSDYRLKKDVVPLSEGLSRINALKPSAYTWIEQNLPGEGFIAHELQEFIPHAVTGVKDAVNEDGSINPQQVDMTHIVPHLVAAIQELSAKNDALEAANAALEARLAALEAK
jgi:hypothetical protein